MKKEAFGLTHADVKEVLSGTEPLDVFNNLSISAKEILLSSL